MVLVVIAAVSRRTLDMFGMHCVCFRIWGGDLMFLVDLGIIMAMPVALAGDGGDFGGLGEVIGGFGK